MHGIGIGILGAHAWRVHILFIFVLIVIDAGVLLPLHVRPVPAQYFA